MEALLKSVEEKRALWTDDMDSGTFVDPIMTILSVFDKFTKEEKKILAKKIYSLVAEQSRSPHLTFKFRKTILKKAKEIIMDVDILPEFQTIFDRTMCLAYTNRGPCFKMVPINKFSCSEHPLIHPKEDYGFPQINPFSVDFSHFDLVQRPVPSLVDSINIVKSGAPHEIAQLAADIQRMESKNPTDQNTYYDSMITTSLRYENLQALEIFWQSTYYYDRNSPYYSDDLETAAQVSYLKEFKHVLSAFIHFSSVCPEEIYIESLKSHATPEVLAYIDTLPLYDDGVITPEDLRQDWCTCESCKDHWEF